MQANGEHSCVHVCLRCCAARARLHRRRMEVCCVEQEQKTRFDLARPPSPQRRAALRPSGWAAGTAAAIAACHPLARPAVPSPATCARAPAHRRRRRRTPARRGVAPVLTASSPLPLPPSSSPLSSPLLCPPLCLRPSRRQQSNTAERNGSDCEIAWQVWQGMKHPMLTSPCFGVADSAVSR